MKLKGVNIEENIEDMKTTVFILEEIKITLQHFQDMVDSYKAKDHSDDYERGRINGIAYCVGMLKGQASICYEGEAESVLKDKKYSVLKDKKYSKKSMVETGSAITGSR